MTNSNGPVKVLSTEECWNLLGTAPIGRIVTRVADVVDIFPVNFVVDGESIVLRTAEGNKLAELTISSEVLFEVDHFDEAGAWSVVLRGQAKVLATEAEIQAAEALPLKPFVPTVKRNFVRITATAISGRQFFFAPEPPRDGPQDY